MLNDGMPLENPDWYANNWIPIPYLHLEAVLNGSLSNCPDCSLYPRLAPLLLKNLRLNWKYANEADRRQRPPGLFEVEIRLTSKAERDA